MKNEEGEYSQEYLDAVNKIANDEVALQKALADLKSTGYVNSKEDFIKAATDKKIGAVHQYISSIKKPEPIIAQETMGDYPDPSRSYNLTKVSSKVVREARLKDKNAYKGWEGIDYIPNSDFVVNDTSKVNQKTYYQTETRPEFFQGFPKPTPLQRFKDNVK